MKVRKIEKEDYELVKELFQDVFSRPPWNDNWDKNGKLDSYFTQLVDNPNSISLLLEDDHNTIIGGSLGYLFDWWQGKEYFIKEFFIINEMQNQGNGKIFIKKLEEFLIKEEITAIWLLTESTVPAFKFYQACDFKLAKETKFFYKTLIHS